MILYLPIIRGNQYDLLALRELSQRNLISGNIVPVIEPIKATSTLITTLQSYIESGRQICVIINPRVGAFLNDPDETNEHRDLISELLLHENVIKGYYIHDDSENEINSLVQSYDTELENLIVINSANTDVSVFNRIFRTIQPLMHIISASIITESIAVNKVILNDNFNTRTRNADFEFDNDEIFSLFPFTYSVNGYYGYSDYSMIGDRLPSSGGPAYAVAIHIIYNYRNEQLRIKHFVSDTNDTPSNPTGKFSEAVAKLVNWINDNDILRTYAIEEFLEHYHNGTSPGLPSVKKLSLMHHLQLVDSLYVEQVI